MIKSEKIAEMVAPFLGQSHDPHYLAYFDYFNRGLFYEAHDVLENLWLPLRKTPAGDFYKGLIQLAGAFVHLQKDRLKPGNALFKLAEANLAKYGEVHETLALPPVRNLINRYSTALVDSNFSENPLTILGAPRLALQLSGMD